MNYELGVVIPIQEKVELSDFLTNISLILIKNSINTSVTLVASDPTFHLDVSDYDNIQKKYLLNLKCITTKNQLPGYGRLIRLGIANTSAKYILVTLPNQGMNADQIPEMLTRCRSGVDLVIVNRFSGGGKASGLKFANRIQILFQIVTSFAIVSRMPKDSTFAFRMFDKSIYEYLAVSGNSWDMMAEQTIKTILSKSNVENIDSRSMLSPNSTVKFSYISNIWSYSRVITRGFLHRINIPWF